MEPKILQIKQALIMQGVHPHQLEGLSQDELLEMCDENLSESLTGNKNWENSDIFIKKLEYNALYTLPSGEKINVAKAATFTLHSGRKVEIYVDIAGNQYFQYRAADGTLLKEDYFKKQEKMYTSSGLHYKENKLFKKDKHGRLTEVICDEATNKVPSLSTNTVHNPKTVDKPAEHHAIFKELLIDSKGKIDMEQFSLDFIKQKYRGNEYKIEYSDNKNIIVKDKNDKEIINVTINEDNSIFYSFKDIINNYSYEIQDGIVYSYLITKPNNDYDLYNYDEIGRIIENEEYRKKGDIDISKSYLNGTLEWTSTENTKTKEKIIKQYSDGILYRETRIDKNGNGNEYNYFSEKLRNFIIDVENQQKTLKKSQLNELIKLINKDNVWTILYDYEQQYGEKYSVLIDNKYCVPKLAVHIKKCYMEAIGYKQGAIRNSQVKNNYYQSKNVYDILFGTNHIIIKNKTTGQTSFINTDKLFLYLNVQDYQNYIEIFRKLPGETLEFIAHEIKFMTSLAEFQKINELRVKNGFIRIRGYYSKDKEMIRIDPTHIEEIIHEVGHAVDFTYLNGSNESRAVSSKYSEAFERGVKKFEAAGYPRCYIKMEQNKPGSLKYYFTTNPQECWARIFELLYTGHCDGQDVLIKYFDECIELEKAMIEKTQKMKPDIRLK